MAGRLPSEVAHRPWPLPAGQWTMRQSWRDLLFAHWPVDRALIRPLVPAALEVQEFGGTSWIGVVPFRMVGVMRRPWPDLPWISAFPELNVRVYVEYGGKPGVWFLSLDATNPVAVWAARRFFHLPYHRASMSIEERDGSFHYASRRSAAGAATATGVRESAEFVASYRPTSEVYLARPGTLDHFLTERYCLYAQSPAGVMVRNEVHHAPWPLQSAQASVTTNTMLRTQGVDIDGAPPVLHFSRRLDVVVWDAEIVT